MDLVSDYIALTGGIVRLAGSDKLVHTYAGLAIYVLTQAALRTRRASPIAFQVVVALQLGNEVMDRLYWDSWRWPDTIGDTIATLFWPGMLCLLAGYRRARWRIDETAARRLPGRTEMGTVRSPSVTRKASSAIIASGIRASTSRKYSR